MPPKRKSGGRYTKKISEELTVYAQVERLLKVEWREVMLTANEKFQYGYALLALFCDSIIEDLETCEEIYAQPQITNGCNRQRAPETSHEFWPGLPYRIN